MTSKLPVSMKPLKKYRSLQYRVYVVVVLDVGNQDEEPQQRAQLVMIVPAAGRAKQKKRSITKMGITKKKGRRA